MAIISEVGEEEETLKPKNPSSSSSSTNPSQFNASFDPSNPLGFLEKVFDFLADQTDFLADERVEKHIEAVVRRAVEKRKNHGEIKEEAAAAAIVKWKPAAATVALPPQEKVNGRLKKKTKEKKEESGRVPNGIDMGNYSWTQTLQEVDVDVQIPKGTKTRFVVCEIKRNHLKVGLKGQPPVIDEELCHNVKPDDCIWSIEDQSIISILLTKQNQMEWWNYLVKGDPEIDTQKFEPESNKLSDYDPESRETVERLMFDRRQKAMGLPTTKEMQEQEIVNKLKAEHPELKISWA